MSLFSLPLSVLPDWLVVLELFSVLMSCGWCSGNSSSAFLRQIAANSILATGMAADWPSLSTQSDKRTSQRRQLDRPLKPLMNKSGFSRHLILDISDCVSWKLLIKMHKRKNMHLLIFHWKIIVWSWWCLWSWHWPVHTILVRLGCQNDLAMVALADNRLNNTFLTG